MNKLWHKITSIFFPIFGEYFYKMIFFLFFEEENIRRIK